jgi:hypothetical protein
VCSGAFKTPGVLKGNYRGVVVKVMCAVKSGKAQVIGTLTVSKGAALAAAYGAHRSSLTVTGNVVVDKGGFVILGCKANPDGSGIPCLDDHAKVPKLRSPTVVTGNVIANAPVGILIHAITGLSRAGWVSPETRSAGACHQSQHDGRPGGDRDLREPRQEELGVRRPSMTPGVIYPRIAEPNSVGGSRSGQCTVSTPRRWSEPRAPARSSDRATTAAAPDGPAPGAAGLSDAQSWN